VTSAEITDSLPRFCQLCSEDPDAVFELRIIKEPGLVLHVPCMHWKPAKMPIGIAPAYEDRKSTT
jgi:hypothetical protein